MNANKNPSISSPTLHNSGTKNEERKRKRRNKKKTRSIDLSVPDHSGNKLEQPSPQAGSELEQAGPEASHGPTTSRGLPIIDKNNCNARWEKNGRSRTLYLDGTDGGGLVINLVLPRPEPPRSPPKYEWAPMSPKPKNLRRTSSWVLGYDEDQVFLPDDEEDDLGIPGIEGWDVLAPSDISDDDCVSDDDSVSDDD